MYDCHKCGNPAPRVYDCDHTQYRKYCRECYEDLHYRLTEP